MNFACMLFLPSLLTLRVQDNKINEFSRQNSFFWGPMPKLKLTPDVMLPLFFCFVCKKVLLTANSTDLNKLKTHLFHGQPKTCNNNIEADLFNPYKLGVESHTPHVLESEKKTKTNKPSNLDKHK